MPKDAKAFTTIDHFDVRDVGLRNNPRPVKKTKVAGPINMTVPDERRVKRRSSIGLLNRAIEVQEERGRIYEQEGGERSAAQVAAMFNAAKDKTVLSESDVMLLQVCLKIVRDQKTDGHEDSCLDGTSYMALYGEARLRGVRE